MTRLVVEDQVVRRALVQVEAVDLALEREGVAVAKRQWLQVDLVIRMAERLLEEGRLEGRDGCPGRQVADGLLRRLLDALLEVAVVVAAQQDLALQAWRQRVDELLAERGALFFWHILPAVRVVALDDAAVLLEHGVQQLPEVHRAELVFAALLQLQAIGRKMRKGALAELLELCHAAAQDRALGKDLLRQLLRYPARTRPRKEAREGELQRALPFLLPHGPVVDIAPAGLHCLVLALAAQGIGKARERRARCRQQEIVIAPHGLQRDGEKRGLREELAHLLDERRRLQAIALGIGQRIGDPEVVARLGEAAVEQEFLAEALLVAAARDRVLLLTLFLAGSQCLRDVQAVGIREDALLPHAARHRRGIRAEDVEAAHVVETVLIERGQGHVVEPRRNQRDLQGIEAVA